MEVVFYHIESVHVAKGMHKRSSELKYKNKEAKYRASSRTRYMAPAGAE
jgi:hypothetical protein